MPDQSLMITIDSTSLQKLKSSGFRLYAMAAVSSSNKSGRPLIALSCKDYLSNTTITLGDETTVYISQSPLAENTTVVSLLSSAITTGQMATIDTSGSINVTALGDLPSTILIFNQSGMELTTGLTRAVSGASTPIVGFYTSLGDTVTLAPLNKMFLFFATSVYTLGTVLTTSLAQGVLVDLGKAPASPAPTIAYNVEQGGWVTGDAVWAQVYPPGTSLPPLLVVQPGNNVPRMKRRPTPPAAR